MAVGEYKRIILWSFWILNLLIDVIYIILSWATANNLAQASGNLHIRSDVLNTTALNTTGAVYAHLDVGKTTQALFISNNIWRAPIAACALGGLMVTLFNLMSCVILIRKSITKGGPGFGYGFVVAWAFVMAFFTLLCGLILQGFTDTVETKLIDQETGWTDLMTGAFKATYGFSYLVCVLFALFFLVLLVFQGAVTKEIGIYDQMNQHKRLLEMNALAASGGALQPAGAGINPLAAQMYKDSPI